MSIADKLTTIAENIPKVYQAGYEKGVAEGGGGGGDSWYDTFWDAYQENGERQSYSYAFSGSGWNDKTFRPKYKFIAKTRQSFVDMFRLNSGITTFNSSDYFGTQTVSPHLNYTFFGTFIKEIIFDLAGFGSTGHMFRDCKAESITLYNCGGGFDRTFESCSKLKHLHIERRTNGAADMTFTLASSPLDKDSIINVVDFLSPTLTGKTVTFNRDAVTNAFELEVDAETGEFIPSEKLDEWLALVATKPNWTISLA